MSVAERSTTTEDGHESDETENAKLLGQLDACVQLMQRGSLLLVFHTQVLQPKHYSFPLSLFLSAS